MPPNSYDLATVPSVDAYKVALKKCAASGAFRDSNAIRLQLLRAHWLAPDRTVTSGELADLTSISTIAEVNRRYGRFANELCSHLEPDPEIRIAILVRFSGGDGVASSKRPDLDPSIHWTMLPQVAQALEELGWVKPAKSED